MFVNLLLDLHQSRNVNLTDLRLRDISLPALFREPTTNFMKISACCCHFIYRLSSLRSRGDKELCMSDCSRRHILILSCLNYCIKISFSMLAKHLRALFQQFFKILITTRRMRATHIHFVINRSEKIPIN